jgi:hypothetical protein
MSEWQTIETAPKDCTDGIGPTVLLTFVRPETVGKHTMPERPVVTGYWLGAQQRWSFAWGFIRTPSPEPTHWMPLPAPPGESK